jgi:hypothetical protein
MNADLIGSPVVGLKTCGTATYRIRIIHLFRDASCYLGKNDAAGCYFRFISGPTYL